jgi:hypothetical protein
MQLRDELVGLQWKLAKIIGDSTESRRDYCEELARLYYCTEVLDAEGKSQGPMCSTFELLWDLPDRFIQYLTTQMELFVRGTPDTAETDTFLETWGFQVAPPVQPSKASSDASPVEPNSKPDSEPVAGTPADSTASSPAKS